MESGHTHRKLLTIPRQEKEEKSVKTQRVNNNWGLGVVKDILDVDRTVNFD